MHSNHDASQSPASQPQQADTGPGAHPTTHEDGLSGFTRGQLAWLEACERKEEASAAATRALVACHRENPFLSLAERTAAIDRGEQLVENAVAEAARLRQRALDLAGGRSMATVARSPMLYDPIAVVVITIQRDRIRQNVSLHMGGAITADRTWDRVGKAGAVWGSVQEDFADRGAGLGVELAEFVDGIDLPTRVADMLPRPVATGADFARRAAEEARRG